MSRLPVLERNHAIIIGGGIAGLLAAAILTKHFGRVTLIERDRYPDEPVFRAGVPQGRHVHTMLLRGQRLLENLFPELEKQLLAQGATPRFYGHESLYYYGGRCPRIPAVLRGWNCSRHLLEWQIRQFLTASPSLNILEGYEVVHLVGDRASQAVSGVRLRARGDHRASTEPETEVLEGDLVVDASGSTSRAPQWLRELGYEAPPESVVDACLGYATCTYDPPSTQRPEWKGIAIQATGQLRRGGSLMEVENGRWMVVLAGTGEGNHPSIQPEDYLEFARSLPDQALYEAMKQATPITPIYGYRRTENRLRHFEKLQSYPEGFIVIGDAVCCFNPIYGQGMTVAGEEVLLLERCLRAKRRWDNFAFAFQKKVPRVLAFPWLMATAADRTSEEPQTKGFSRRYMEALVALLPKDQAVLLAFLRVVHMVRPPLTLIYPGIFAKVVAQMYRQRAQ